MDSLVRVFGLHQAVADLVIQQANSRGLFDRGVLKGILVNFASCYVKLLRNVRAARALAEKSHCSCIVGSSLAFLELAPKDAEEAA